MSKPTNGNGNRIIFGKQELTISLASIGMIIGGAMGYGSLNQKVSANDEADKAQWERMGKISDQGSQNAQDVTALQGDIKRIDENVKDIKDKQESQQQLLTTILVEVQKRK